VLSLGSIGPPSLKSIHDPVSFSAVVSDGAARTRPDPADLPVDALRAGKVSMFNAWVKSAMNKWSLASRSDGSNYYR
jgi:hypothetical protein